MIYVITHKEGRKEYVKRKIDGRFKKIYEGKK